MSVFDAEPAWDLLEGAIDLHVHTGPDLVTRNGSAVDLARAVGDAGMARAVVKSHVEPTASRAALVNDEVGAGRLAGGVALNGSVGGLNPDAVEVALDLGAELVWLPTAWSANHAAQLRAAGEDRFVGQRVPGPEAAISVLAGDTLDPAVERIVDMVAEADAVLGTGHIGADAIDAAVAACEEAGADCLVNHAFFEAVDLPLDRQETLAARGATLEYCAFAVESTAGHTVERVADAVDRIGPDNVAIATDFGQAANPPVEGFARFLGALRDAGLEASQVRTACVETPNALLGV